MGKEVNVFKVKEIIYNKDNFLFKANIKTMQHKARNLLATYTNTLKTVGCMKWVYAISG